jgi:hypothetical protein
LAFVFSSAAIGMAIIVAGHSAGVLQFEVRSYFESAYRLIHRELPTPNTASQQFTSFACSLLFILAILVPGMAASVAWLLTKEPRREGVRS